eukprot:6751161-Alexandrium_andersonii.AAC.1
MSPIRAQSPRLWATVYHAQYLPREDEPPRAVRARSSEGGRGEPHHPGLRSCRLPCTGCPSGMGCR